jgi:hypothetical protein
MTAAARAQRMRNRTSGNGFAIPGRSTRGDEQGCALQPGFVAGLIVDQLAFEAASLGPAQVHSEQHLRPILRLGATGARVNRDDGILAIVLTAKHLLDLAGLDLLIERLERLAEFGIDRFASLRPLDEHREVVALFFQRSDEIEFLLQPAPALQNLLGVGLVFPEIRRGRARLEAGQFLLGFGGLRYSADRQRVC